MKHGVLAVLHAIAWALHWCGARLTIEGAYEPHRETAVAVLRLHHVKLLEVTLYKRDMKPRTPTLPDDYTGA